MIDIDSQLTPEQWDMYEAMRARLNSLYYIFDEKRGQPVLWKNQPYHDYALKMLCAGYLKQIAVKGRQVYFTTFMTVLMVDMCIARPNFSCAVHNMTEKDMKGMIEDKVHYCVNHSPFAKEHVEKDGMVAEGVRFKNGSKIMMERSGRSHTHQFNLITEAAYTAEVTKSKFKELIQGMLLGSQYYIMFLESSPYGGNNDFTDMIRQNVEAERAGRLSKEMSFPVNFIPWWRKPANWLPDSEVPNFPYDTPMREYFEAVERSEGTTLTPNQRAYYMGKLGHLRNDVKHMRSEFPSTIEEALSKHSSAYILAKKMQDAKEDGRITMLMRDERTPVIAAWDFGAKRSATAVILLQEDKHNRGFFKLVYSFQSTDMKLSHMLHDLNQQGWNIVRHLLPHDSKAKGSVAAYHADKLDTTIERLFHESNVFNTLVVSKITNKIGGFEASQDFCDRCAFCANRATAAIDALRQVQRDYDAKTGIVDPRVLSTDPETSEHNHLYDAFELAARAYKGGQLNVRPNFMPAMTEHEKFWLEHDGCLV